MVVTIRYTPISISYPENAAVEKTIQKDLDKMVADFLQSARNYEEEAKTYYKEYLQNDGQSKDFTPYVCSLDSKPARQDTCSPAMPSPAALMAVWSPSLGTMMPRPATS